MVNEIRSTSQKEIGVVVTTSHNPSKEAVELAKKLSQNFKVPYYNRRHLSERVKTGEIKIYYVVDNNLQLSVIAPAGRLFFHPGMAKIRMENYKRDGRDLLLEALRPSYEDIIYDATFGLGMDAVFMAHFVKQVIGTEVSVHIYRVVSYGLSNYKSKEEWINEAVKKIVLFNDDMKDFIKRQPDKSFDIVYCDPMFENPVYESSALNPLRPLASYDTIDTEIVEEMIRIARKRVVIKTLIKDSLLERLSVKFDRVITSKRSGLIYACVDLDR
ncbi:class I SAM-dependent methyltransferase [Fervidobacterium islandicum]|uniref:Class I SAM-dependent methyltransferase n=1 Tax=Fervidobacterium islandicum TaxID=2423 RepID=A0AAI8CND0_FERIS|nr:class I SAM-dependent methyltransferase [Fervidobacterium islandicum]AMW33581.1 class I SAM-dependent methyltransferase [Fervidobacterium islandicum]